VLRGAITGNADTAARFLAGSNRHKLVLPLYARLHRET
jgi:hypothetical protein